MIRCFLCICAILVCSPFIVAAESLGRVISAESGATQRWGGKSELTLRLTQPAPFRVFVLNEPRRLVLDFKNTDLSDVSPDAFVLEGEPISAVRFGVIQPGWSRFVADLTEPVVPEDVALTIQPDTGLATLSMMLEPVAAEEFAARSGAPQSALWQPNAPDFAITPVMDDRFIVVLDPGHGGIDPGAERDGLSEKALMLDVAEELRDVLRRAGDVEVILTRESDVFVSLDRRVAIAHRSGADMFLSLHADALSQGGARGATVYTLSEEASDTATAHLAARHNRADVLAGMDLTAADDEVTRVLLDIARRETEPRSEALALSLIAGMSNAGGPMNRRPLRQAGFAVLKSADIPSVLVEVGFLSSKRDLENLRNADWRSGMVKGIAEAILDWREKDRQRQTLLRQ